MSKEEMLERIGELAEDEIFMEACEKATSQEELSSLFSEKGLDLSGEEMKAFLSELKEQEGELSEESLEEIAGGRLYRNPNPGCIPNPLEIRLKTLIKTAEAKRILKLLTNPTTLVQGMKELKNWGK